MMTEQSLTVTEFVRGLAWHDIAKPFALAQRKHINLGHRLLCLANHEGEALVALTHHGKEGLKEYLQTAGSPAELPALPLLAGPLDRLAASVYSLQPKGQRSPIHSRQNPFSRLPIEIHDIEQQFMVEHAELAAKIGQPLWATTYERLPVTWQHALMATLEEQLAERVMAPDETVLPDVEAALAILTHPMRQFPERTYPPMNDTSLWRHSHLSSVLGFVVYKNLEARPEADIWSASVRLDAEGAFDRPPCAYDDQLEGTVRNALQASLVRIALVGHRHLFQQAVRVDDLHGSLELANLTRQAFKRALADGILNVPELTDFLPISENTFELFYILPGKPEQVPDLRRQVRRAYAGAVAETVDTLLEEHLTREFPEIAVKRATLRAQLSALSYGVHVIPLSDPAAADVDFDTFAAAYGSSLLKAYVESRAYADYVVTESEAPEELPSAETCDVCGNHPVLSLPTDVEADTQAAWLEKRDYAAHRFRGESEALCLSCVARRVLSYGTVAKRMDPIVQPMFTQQPDGTWRVETPQAGPDIPPAANRVIVCSTDKPGMLKDVGAFFVRPRRTRQGVDTAALDVFPTVEYAADRESNVVLLALQPTTRLWQAYTYTKALEVASTAELTEASSLSSQWKVAFERFYTQQIAEPRIKALTRVARPHLARVLERRAHLKAFYADLYRRLAETPPEGHQRLRVLPLDLNVPTLRLLAPADRLDEVLQVLDQVVTESLFSATYFEDLEKRKEAHKLLRLIVPDLLHGAVVLFKQKFPLYLALEAERDIFHQLEVSDPTAPQDKRSRPGNADWYGFRLGFSDLRGSLSEVGPLHAEATYSNLGTVLDLVKHVDRRTIVQYAETATYMTPELARAQALVRANQISRTSVKKVMQMNEDEELFGAIYFITRAIRR
jgi:hypothetical protein